MIECSRQAAMHYQTEIHKCRKSVEYFLTKYGQIHDATTGGWVAFDLWPAQQEALHTIAGHRLSVILKARQLGLTWLVLGYALWLMLFCPAATVLLFSRRDEEAVDLLTVRLRGMYVRLPAWLQVQAFVTDNDHEWAWSNGSRGLGLPHDRRRQLYRHARRRRRSRSRARPGGADGQRQTDDRRRRAHDPGFARGQEPAALAVNARD